MFTLKAYSVRFALDSNSLFDYPWLYAVGVNTWTFTDEEAARMRDYLGLSTAGRRSFLYWMIGTRAEYGTEAT